MFVIFLFSGNDPYIFFFLFWLPVMLVMLYFINNDDELRLDKIIEILMCTY